MRGGTIQSAFSLLAAVYVVGVVVGAGFYVDEALQWTGASFRAAEVRALVVVLGGLYLLLRVLTHTPTPFAFRPYLVLPISQRTLAHCGVVGSIFNKQNFLLAAFCVPAILDQVEGVAQGGGGLLILGLVIIAVHGASIVLQSMLLRRIGIAGMSIAILGGGVAMVGVESEDRIGHVVAALADGLQLATAHPVYATLLLTGMALTSYAAAYRTTRSQLRVDDGRSPSARTGSGRTLERILSRRPVYRLTWLELTMIMRNRRPRANLLGVGGFVLFGVLTVLNPALQSNLLFVAPAGLITSAAFVLTHGSLMFSWETAFADGLFSRPVDVRHLVWAKFAVLLGAVGAVGALLSGLLALTSPSGIVVIVSVCVYNAGVSAPLVLWDAVRHARSVDLSGRILFNYEEGGALWVAAVILVPVASVPALTFSVAMWSGIVAAPGIVGVLAAPWWLPRLARELRKRKPAFAESARR